MSQDLAVGVLGPLTVRVGGTDQRLGGPAPRALILRLVVAGGRMVPAELLIDEIWPEGPPPSALATLQAYVSRLRRVLEPDRGPRRPPRVLLTQGPGYALRLPPDALDADRFAALARQGRTLLAAGDPAAALAAFDEALDLWRGPAYADCNGHAFARPEAHRLEELRISVTENRHAATLELGDHEASAAALEAFTDAYPYRERGWELRALALYRQGRQGDALATLRTARQRLADELGTDPGPGLLTLQTAILGQDPALLRAAPTAPASVISPDSGARPTPMRHNLPGRLSALVGREHERSTVERLLRTHRLVTLTGAGGMGKTRLALEVARARDDADGPWLVELADVRDATALPSTIAATLGISAVGGITALAAALRHRRAILLLDNCEHLVEPLAPLVTELLQACPDLRVLATSREALEAEGECVYEVPPLSAGEDGDAVRLFLDRAAAAAPQWRPDPDERGLLARLCADLDGMPLAIELAAAQCKVLSPRQIAGLLDGRFGLLRGLRTNPRHETLRAAVEWSYDLLTDDEREVFQALAVFEGGFVLEAAQAVTGRTDVVVHLSSLVAKSLVVVVGGDPRRYRMLETLRCYAAGRTEPEGRAEFVRRHVEWVRSLADIADAALRGHLGPGWVQRLHDESANARAAMNVADPATVLRIATEFFWFWYRQGHMTEGLRYLEPAMAHFDESGPAVAGPAGSGPAGSGPAVSGLAVAGAPDHAMLARAAVALALLRYLNGDQPGVLDALHRAGRHAALTDDAAARANALTAISYFEAHGSPAAAREHGIQALHFARQAGTPGTEAQALMVLGEVERQAGRWDEAVRFLAQAQARARDCGYTWCEGSALWIEAKVELARERWQQAAAVLQSAVEAAYGNSDRTSWVAGLATLSYLWCRVGRLDEAADLAALAECQGTRIGFSAEAMDADMARYAAELRAALPAEALAAALARARDMSPADAMEVARKVPATIGWG